MSTMSDTKIIVLNDSLRFVRLENHKVIDRRTHRVKWELRGEFILDHTNLHMYSYDSALQAAFEGDRVCASTFLTDYKLVLSRIGDNFFSGDGIDAIGEIYFVLTEDGKSLESRRDGDPRILFTVRYGSALSTSEVYLLLATMGKIPKPEV